MTSMAGEGGVDDTPRNICRFCNKNAVTKVVTCTKCGSILHRYCCERRGMEIGVNNKTDCCVVAHGDENGGGQSGGRGGGDAVLSAGLSLAGFKEPEVDGGKTDPDTASCGIGENGPAGGGDLGDSSDVCYRGCLPQTYHNTEDTGAERTVAGEMSRMKVLLQHKDVIIRYQADLIDSLKDQIQLMRGYAEGASEPANTRKDGRMVRGGRTEGRLHGRVPIESTETVDATDSNVRVRERERNGAGEMAVTSRQFVSKVRTKVESKIPAAPATLTSSQLSCSGAGASHQSKVKSKAGNVNTSGVNVDSGDDGEVITLSQVRRAVDGAVAGGVGRGRRQKPDNAGDNQIVGAAESGVRSFAGVARRAWFYVGRVKTEATAEDVGEYLGSKFCGRSFDVQMLPKRADSNSVSFRVGADVELMDKLSEPATWPCGVVVRRYRFFRGGGRTEER